PRVFDDSSDKLQVVSGDGRAHSCRGRLIAEQLACDLEKIFVHLVFVGKRDGWRFFVSTLYQPDAGSQRYQACDIGRGSVQVGLHANPDVRVSLPNPPVNFQRPVNIRARLHVDPDGTSIARSFDNAHQIRVADLLIKVQTKLSQ